jgi:HAD superfamily hydrolase (TIGR01549 family)
MSDNGSKSRKLSALLFDYGGTLAFLDFELLAIEFSRPGRRLDALRLEHAEYEGRAALDRCLLGTPTMDLGAAYEEFFRSWMRAAGIPADEIREVGERFRELHRQASMWRVIRPGTFEALERLKSAGLKLAIVSNADGRVESDARRFGLASFFDVIVDSQVVGVEKPDPRIFRVALERLGARADEAMYVGDVYSIDMLGAQAAGIPGKLIDQHGRYNWVEHEKIRHVGELDAPAQASTSAPAWK